MWTASDSFADCVDKLCDNVERLADTIDKLCDNMDILGTV